MLRLWDRLLRVLLHIPVGIVNAFIMQENAASGVTFAAYFAIYELNEDWHIKDQAWKDVQGWLVGFAVYYICEVLWF